MSSDDGTEVTNDIVLMIFADSKKPDFATLQILSKETAWKAKEDSAQNDNVANADNNQQAVVAAHETDDPQIQTQGKSFHSRVDRHALAIIINSDFVFQVYFTGLEF